jgi:hypothetical protein
MKQLTSVFILFLLVLSLPAATSKSSPLVGKWRGEDGGEVGFITFDHKGYVTFSIRDQEIGGKEYLSDGVVYDMIFETDESKTPYAIDFIIRTHNDLEEIARMPGIYKLVDKETLVINMKFDGSERPKVFDDSSNDQITLRKT